MGNCLLLDTGSTFTFLPSIDYYQLLSVIYKADNTCSWKGEHFICPGDEPAPIKYPTLMLKVEGQLIEFGPKQYFWFYPGFGLYLAVKMGSRQLINELAENEK